MAENSAIEWTDHTFNPWEGCQKLGPGCDHCYAETRNARFGGGTALNWGPGAERRRTSASNWRKPLRWQADAAAFRETHGRRQRVFCASLADVFDNAAPPSARRDLAKLIRETPDLDWLLLTKRIGNAAGMLADMFPGGMPANVWVGATVVNQAEADRDVPKLLAVPARVRFLSMEPLLGPVDFDPCDLVRLDWIIVGGESGTAARPMHPAWARSLRDQCSIAGGVPFLFKQWGEWVPVCAMTEDLVERCYRPAPAHRPEAPRRCKVGQCVLHSDGTRFDGEAMYRRPAFEQGSGAMTMFAVGKKAAGRLLDGAQHDGVPA